MRQGHDAPGGERASLSERSAVRSVELFRKAQASGAFRNPAAVDLGIQPQLAAMETIVYPRAAQLQQSESLALSGTIEIAPLEAPLTVFVWSRNRVVPVRLSRHDVGRRQEHAQLRVPAAREGDRPERQLDQVQQHQPLGRVGHEDDPGRIGDVEGRLRGD